MMVHRKPFRILLISISLICFFVLKSIAQQKVEIEKLTSGREKRMEWWKDARIGMFIHWGSDAQLAGEYKGNRINGAGEWIMYDAKIPVDEYRKIAETFNPVHFNADEWVRTARDAGMKYAVLTTKHVSGHCLWPSKYTDYHVGTSDNKTDVVRDFVNSCTKYGIMPEFYYCSWDKHHIMDSGTPSYVAWKDAYSNEQYREFQWNQLEEILTQYGKIEEVWIDISGILRKNLNTLSFNV